MSDAELDQKLRAMSVELAESSPAAPAYEELHERAGVAVTEVPVVPPARPEDGPRRPGFWQKTLGVLGVGVAVGGGAFALAALTEDDGANTPQAAVEEFIEAVAAEDAIGVGETLVPSERDLVLDYLDPVLAELQRLDLAGADADARDVAGLEFTADLDSLRVQESPLSDSVTRVRILDGDLGFDGNYDALPVGDAVRDDGPLADPDPVDLLADVFGGQADVMTVKGSDGWHVSVFYTLAEYLRSEAGLPSINLGGGPAPVGAESPEGLVSAVIDGAVAGDFASLLPLADPVDGAVLYDYWPVFAPDWADSLERVIAEGPYAEVRFFEVDVTGEGTERVASLTGWDYGLISDGSSTDDFTFDGTCFTSASASAASLEESDALPTSGCIGDTVEFEGQTLSAVRSGLVDLAVVERDGRWYLRPGATLIENWLAGASFVNPADGVGVFGVLVGAYPWPPAWSFGAGGPYLGTVSGSDELMEEAGGAGPGPSCALSLGDAELAACLTEVFGDEVTATDVQGCRSAATGGTGDELERSWELEGCIVDMLYPPTPVDLFLDELMACPGGGNPEAVELSPEEQQLLVECARTVFEGETVPAEILSGMADCLGVDIDGVAAVTDVQALVLCGVDVISGTPGTVKTGGGSAGAAEAPADEVDAADPIAVDEPTEQSATLPPVPTSQETGQD